jgi:hypothetical protein
LRFGGSLFCQKLGGWHLGFFVALARDTARPVHLQHLGSGD